MALRFHSLKTRTAIALSSVIVVILVINAAYLILTKQRELRQGIESRAETFATLTRAPICYGYETYYASGFYKFRELMRDLLRMNPDVERIQIINVNGQVLFDSTELEDGGPPRAQAPARWIQDPERLEAVKGLDTRLIRDKKADGEETLEIIAPYLEDWGRHKLSVSYAVSYQNLQPSIRLFVLRAGGLTLLSIGLVILVAVAMATRITRSLSVLTAGAKDIAEGHFDRRLDIRSHDELQVLAETFNDMTERLKENVEQLEESNKKLAAVNEELKELDRLKSDLLANVSHELRTPLTAIKGYTDYILERKLGPVTEKQEKGLVVVQRNLERLSKSINALLDFSRMEMGRIALNPQPFNLAALVEQLHTTVRSELDKKGLHFVADIEDALPLVVADREKISAVLENLVINAIKFTPEGGRITVRAVRAPAGNRLGAEVRVEDTGIGIPADQIGRIFQRFHQVDGSSTRRFGGVGLGLSIVKTILEAHGSSVQVDSQQGRGTTFRFHLPLVERAEPVADRAAAPPAAARREAAESLVLVVDDDPDMVAQIQGSLEEEGLAVISAGTAAEGASLAADRHPDLILLDLLLPDQSGLELLQVLKRQPGTQHIPVMVVSVMNDSLKGLTLGASGYLVKPVQKDELLSTVRRLLEGTSGRRPTVLVVDDERDTAELIRETLRHEGLRPLVAHDGREALEQIARRRPDVVILDIMMPEMSGFEVLEALHRDRNLSRIPVLVLTARGDEEDARRGMALGARRYMSKPFDVGDLVAEVRRHLGPPVPEEERRVSL
jgi:signal transduction histidine kinase/DNA-binding response OmpR family regulator